MACKKRNSGKVNRSLRIRLLLDIAATALMLASLAFRITGDTAHEWIGLAAAFVFIFHNVLNFRWYYGHCKIAKFVNTPKNFFNTVLISAAALTVFTGLLHSRHVFGFLDLPGGETLRIVHTTSAYWFFTLASVHIGLHWSFIASASGFTRFSRNPFVKVALWGFAAITALAGIFAAVERGIFGKMFFGYSFDFWDTDNPSILFFAENVLIMAFFAILSHGFKLTIERINK